jgi:prepilin-type N-terminal cleavage/methylation domain-containing protein
MQLTRRIRSEAGFTLVELLVAIVILGVIAVPLSGVAISALKHTVTTSDRMALSHDAQISSSYFGRDVAQVGLRESTPSGGTLPFKPSVQLDAAYNAGGTTCGTAATPTAFLRLLSDAWYPGQSMTAPRTNVVAYYLKPVGDVSELHRIKCVGPATVSADDVVLAHNVKPGSVTVTCSSTCEAAAVPAEITVRFLTTKPSVGDYEVTLNGQRRQS